MYSIDDKDYPCSTSVTMRFIGGKWKAAIIKYLAEKKRYSELRKDLVNITERTLSLQLKELEADGIVIRTVYTSKPPLRVEYELSDFGKTLLPLIQTISDFGKEIIKNNDKVHVVSPPPCSLE
ncbi:winged helix-turn-helix transcriptional regulator [Myroides odoratimimus]|uniref:winged helix-turn-helix transcriptional regulator n=1 Tax=Myroides odoratimimus TaxID=76832 RepID=UPI0038D49006